MCLGHEVCPFPQAIQSEIKQFKTKNKRGNRIVGKNLEEILLQHFLFQVHSDFELATPMEIGTQSDNTDYSGTSLLKIHFTVMSPK